MGKKKEMEKIIFYMFQPFKKTSSNWNSFKPYPRT